MSGKLEVRDQNTNELIFSTEGIVTEGVAKILGTLFVGHSYTGNSAGGSVTNGGFLEGGNTPFFIPIAGEANREYGDTFTLTLSGSTLYWNYSGATRPNFIILYGTS